MKVAVARYHARLREMGCIVTGRTDRVTIHHCHSGSMVERGVTRGVRQKVSDWLVIPLDLYLHSMGPEAIDGSKGVKSWEAQYGSQVQHIDRLVAETGIDVWELAKAEAAKSSKRHAAGCICLRCVEVNAWRALAKGSEG